jgi:hypothetical protein
VIDIDNLRLEIGKLSQEVFTLREENSLLHRKVEILEKHPTLAKGIAGETLVAKLLGGALTEKNATHDISLERSGIKIEVKYSNLNLAVDYSTTYRWAWSNIFGESGKKVYDRLLLVGDTDPRWREQYLDPESPYVIFDIPLNEAMPLTTQTGRYRSIQLLTNPRKVRSAAASMFTRYQVTLAHLSEKYGI